MPFCFSYVEKKSITPNTPLYIHGDIHGDAKSLALYLEELMQQGVLDDSWHIAPPYNLIFLGDYIDRGHYNIETLFILAMLKMHNCERITLIQGNHDTIFPTLDPALQQDIIRNIADEKEQNLCIHLIHCFFKSLPSALFTQVKNTLEPEAPTNYTLLFCHGGCSYEHTTLAHFLAHPTYKYEACPFSVVYAGNIYSLVDFYDGLTDFQKLGGEITDHGQLLYKNGAIEWMSRYNVSAIFRGHQHATSIAGKYEQFLPARFMRSIVDGEGVAKLWRPADIPAEQLLWNRMVCTLNVTPDSAYGEGCNFDYDTFIKLTVAQTFEQSAYEQYQIAVVPAA